MVGWGYFSLCCTAAVLALSGARDSVEMPIAFTNDGGEAWTFDKHIEVSVWAGACDGIAITSPRQAVFAKPVGARASAEIALRAGENTISAQCRKDGYPRGSEVQQRWFVRLEDVPKARITLSAENGTIKISAANSEAAPESKAAISSYEWHARATNPSLLQVLPATGRDIALPVPAAEGEYFVTLNVTDRNNATDESTASFRVRGGTGAIVNSLGDRPAWSEDAIVYGVVPGLFGRRGFQDVLERLDDLANLGVTALLLAPVAAAEPNDFGYAVTDPFRLRPDFGSEEDLHRLIEAAHHRNIKVLLDLVSNHLSTRSRYFRDAQNRGRASPYFGYFARNADGAATYYFDWQNLANLNYNNAEVSRLVIESSLYWLRAFDVDGFRVDAAWGPRGRVPDFWPRWREELKRIKPDVLLLAEAPARDPYYARNGFDAAYDWSAALGDWAWRRAYEGADTAAQLRAAISESLVPSGGLVFRFLNNNDTGARFITRYGLNRTRVAAAMLLTLPGLPGLYTGDEIGAAFEPYGDQAPLARDDPNGLRPFYARLIAIRHATPSLRTPELELLDVGDSRVLAYLRPSAKRAGGALVLLNYGDSAVDIALPANAFSAARALPHFRDLMSGETVSPSAAGHFSLEGYGIRILALQ